MEPLTVSDFGANETTVIQNNKTLSFDFQKSHQLANEYLTKGSARPSLFDYGNMNEHVSEEYEGIDMNGIFNDSFHLNNRSRSELPNDMQFNEGNLIAIIFYSLMMAISAVGNIAVFSVLMRLRMKGRLSRINLFLLHLAIADLLVTFSIMPLEIIWNATVSWKAGDMMCRVMSFFRIFGLLLSGNVLVCISLDRYFAILKPLSIPNANSRGRTMLAVGWLLSVLCSLPQSFIFHVEQHPVFSWYEQCVTFNSFPSQEYELAYNFFGFFFLYGLPLIIIIVCYSRILCKIYRISALTKNDNELRRSNTGALRRAKSRTLKMTVIILATFFFCWTPYNVMSLWYWIDKKSASEVDHRIQKGLFLFACTNSCFNPLIYGLFHFCRPKKGSTGTTASPSFQTGHHRLAIPSEFTRVMGKHENHFHIRRGQQTWVRDGQCFTAQYNVHQKQHPIPIPPCRIIKMGANGYGCGGDELSLRKCKSFQTAGCNENGFRASTCCVDNSETKRSTLVHFVDYDKKGQRHCLSSTL